ncbi:hypothetical protein GCM10007388_33680 [Pseudoduganella plicata]|uniref:Uncharacterized protein n=1 Tax=Pseudoduganella plicata TaxID=321984 RepID=A0AA87Y9K2_9BURK|nr:hypothetical protein GCM10007388_33680 [Pseudoduganella plicata]
MQHGQIHDPPHAGVAGEVQGQQRLRHFVGHDGVEEEQRRDAVECHAQRVDVQQVALHGVHAGRQVSHGESPDEGAHAGAALDELGDDVAADGARGTGNEDGHVVAPGR